MAKKLALSLIVALYSLSVYAIPPAAPSAFYNKIRLIAARNCVTEGGVRVSEFKDTDRVIFVLKLNKEATAGVLIMMEEGIAVDSLDVTCN